jgi:hypothetical protein
MTSRHWFTPSKESLLVKRTGLEQQVAGLEASSATAKQQGVLQRCRQNLEEVVKLDEPWRPSHPHLAWRLLHRVDHDLLLLLPGPEVLASAQGLLATFDMNVTEPKVRASWLGQDGKAGLLAQAIERLRTYPDDEAPRHLLRQALSLVNDQVDRDFWVLSINTLTSVASGIALGVAMLAFGWLDHASGLAALGTGKMDGCQVGRLALLGLMGGYLSNVLTKEGFLYLRGGPFWRYVLLHLVSRPILSAFGAVMVTVLVRAELVLAINPPADRTGLLALQVGQEVGFAYAVLALVAGFAADKVLRDMIGRVLKQLEQKAEKSKDSAPEPQKA